MKREAVQEERQRNKPDNEVESSTPGVVSLGASGPASNGSGSGSSLLGSSLNGNGNVPTGGGAVHNNNNTNSSAANLSTSLFLDLTIEKILEAQKAIEVRVNGVSVGVNLF